MTVDASERFAAELRAAEERLRACGLGGRRAFVALVRHLARRLDVPESLWPEGPDAPAAARLERLPLSPDLDLFGLAYERFFADLFRARRGQYFTPRPLVELVADLAGIRRDDRVLDPTCGSGGFLLAAHDRGADVDGIEVDPDLAALARLNLALHGANPRAVTTADFFAMTPEPTYDVILANPPFSVEIVDPEVLARHGLPGKRVGSDVLFLRTALGWLRPSGRLATLVPYSVLTSPALAPLRRELDAVAVREAVVSLQECVFAPFGGTFTRAAILVLRKRPARVVDTLCAVVTHPGYQTNRRRFVRASPDELVALRLFLRGASYGKAVRVQGASWVPEEAFAAARADVPVFRVGDRAEVRVKRGKLAPEEPCAVISLADVDARTGEIIAAVAKNPADADGFVPGERGDVLYGRMRPELNKVAIAESPDDDLPDTLAVSPEFLPLVAKAEPEFLLLALRSVFAREGLPVTAGQTRPRAREGDIVELELPDPPAGSRARLNAILAQARAERRRLRQVLLDAERLYVEWGRGEIDDAALSEGLAELEGRGQPNST